MGPISIATAGSTSTYGIVPGAKTCHMSISTENEPCCMFLREENDDGEEDPKFLRDKEHMYLFF